MTRDAEADIVKLGLLRKRAKAAETKTIEARVSRDAAESDLAQAQSALRELGLDPDKQSKIDSWIETEESEIEALLKKIDEALGKAQVVVDGR